MKRRIKGIKRKGHLVERIAMSACVVTVLSALTAAGIWMREDPSASDKGYVVDLREMEKNQVQEDQAIGEIGNIYQAPVLEDDMDYDPAFQEAGSVSVKNPDESKSKSMSDGAELAKTDLEDAIEEQGPKYEDKVEGETALSTAMQPTLAFSDEDPLVWPIVGNVLINYSMDQTVYFPTLDQYKYNPAIVISANEGDMVTAAAAGKVSSVYSDERLGNVVKMELGNGYEVMYGQLKDILVSEGSYVAMGDMIASVAAPTKYFSIEGTNIYFQLTKDGEPVNPMKRLG